MLHDHRKPEVNFYEKIDIKFSRYLYMYYFYILAMNLASLAIVLCTTIIKSLCIYISLYLCDLILFEKKDTTCMILLKFYETVIFLDQIKSPVKGYSDFLSKIHRKKSVQEFLYNKIACQFIS